ncbi:MAG: purine-nucleoside phosphorylase [Flavobacteriaceae bacterium]
MSSHLNAKKGEIADAVLLPGDPLRAKWIAETFLEDAFCYSEVRGMLGFTGSYNGKRVSVQGSGMGIPSALIYIHELIEEYGVKEIIRVGTAGSYQAQLQIRDLVLAMAASTSSSINNIPFDQQSFAPTADYDLFRRAVAYAEDNEISFSAGNVLSEDKFYNEDPDRYKLWASYGVLCAEMESAGLYTTASRYGVKALSILTISDSKVTGEHCTHEEREQDFELMVQMALSIARTTTKQ